MKTFNYTQKIITDGRVILIDEPLTKEIQCELQQLQTKDGQELVFLEDRILAKHLEVSLEKISKENNNVLFVFPGNGSNYPRKTSQVWRKYLHTSVHAKRFWSPGMDPISIANEIMPEKFLVTDIKTIVVVDDVISSGKTMRALYKKNSWKFTQAEWIATSWLSQSLDFGIKGYQQIHTACVVKKTIQGKVPINSLSTLRKNEEIINIYSQRHFQKPKKFMDLIRR